MATWNSDNIILTKLGEQVLSKVQSGVGKLTVSRIVSGAGHVSPSQLYNQTQVTDIKQELTIAKCTTTESQSTISANLTNTGLEEAYDLYQIGIYVTHPDFTDEVLYLIAQCDSPDHIPLPGDSPVTLSYDLVMAHFGTKEVIINVSEAGYIDVTTFTEFAEEVNTALNGKANSTDLDEHKNDNTMHVTAEEKASWNGKAELSDIPTSLPANGGNAQALIDYNSTDVRIMFGWRGSSLDSTTYLAGYDTSELESNGIVKIKDINADKAYVGNAGNADTLDGKHASDFVQKSGDSMSGNLRMETNQLWFGTGGINQFCFENTNGDLTLKNHDGATVFAANYGGSYATHADTLDGKHAESFMQWLGIPGDTNILNNANYKVDYHCNISNGTIIGLPIAGWYHIVYYMHEYQNGHGMQIAYPLDFDGATMIRRAIGTTWGAWKNIADGGNAATVNGLTVQTAVPANAKFTDTTYGAASTSANGLMTTGAQTFAGNKTFNGQVIPAGASAVGTAQARKIYAGTSDMAAGTTALETGAIYLVYE